MEQAAVEFSHSNFKQSFIELQNAEKYTILIEENFTKLISKNNYNLNNNNETANKLEKEEFQDALLVIDVNFQQENEEASEELYYEFMAEVNGNGNRNRHEKKSWIRVIINTTWYILIVLAVLIGRYMATMLKDYYSTKLRKQAL